MKNKKVIILFVYIALMILVSIITFAIDNPLWKYDKYVHFFEFFILAILLANIFIANLDLKKFFLLIIFITFLSFFDEGIQIFIPVRSPEWIDLFFDLFGGYLGLFLMYILKDRING
tara:strand:+ start:143 stop:493 length:351 start_codon:yes stop_codon:yes gene_type:complete